MKLQIQKELRIEGSEKLPMVVFRPNGKLKIEGRVIPDELNEFFGPLFSWVATLRSPSVIFDIKSDYLSANGLVNISRLLCLLETNTSVREILLNWYYDEEDEDFYDKGIYLEEKLERTRVNHISCSESFC